MPYSHIVGTQKRYRITLDLSVESDFNPRDIDYAKLFELDGDYEDICVYVEDLNQTVNLCYIADAQFLTVTV